MFGLSLNLWENLTSGFLRQGYIWLVKLKKVEGSVWVEFLKLSSDDRVIEIGDFILTGYCTGFEQSVTALEKISLLFKMSLTPFYPVSGKHLFLLEIGHFASSLLNQF